MREAASRRAARRLSDANSTGRPLFAALPPLHGDNMHNARLALLGSGRVFVVIAVLFAAAAGLFFLISGKQEKTARDAATRFAAALVHNDPGAAPRAPVST